jgi:hypothetical protein
MSLIEKLKAGKRNVKTIKFPGTEDDIFLQILSNADIQDAVFAAERRFKSEEIAITSSTLDAYEDERTTQIIFRALRDPLDPKKPFASTADELRKLLSKEEKDHLVSEYNAFQDECSPRIEEMTAEKFDEIWAALKKNPQTALNFLSSGTQRRLLLYLASLPATSPTPSGSIS